LTGQINVQCYNTLRLKPNLMETRRVVTGDKTFFIFMLAKQIKAYCYEKCYSLLDIVQKGFDKANNWKILMDL